MKVWFTKRKTTTIPMNRLFLNKKIKMNKKASSKINF